MPAKRMIPIRLGGQQPLRMLFIQPRSRRDPFGLEPDERLHAALVGVVADRTKTLREPLRIDFPRADLRPTLFLNVPAGIHPPVIQLAVAPPSTGRCA